ncbi:MAG: PTS sugar transporter subunit IIC [Lachnospiraceae bacterium]|nr:PTS sugar transporter subunit IIC [Lachnospiraceae bacterium]
MVQAILCALLVWVAENDMLQLLSFFSRPIVLGPLTGLIFGDVQTGLMVGVAIETMFLATVHVGTAFPPDATFSTVIATAFAIAAGSEPSVAIAAALPLSVIGQLAFYLRMSVLDQWGSVMYEKACAEENEKMMNFWHVGWSLLISLVLYGVPTFLAVYVSGDIVQLIIDKIPTTLISGINAGAGMLAAVGLAMLLKAVNGKGLWPFLLIGYFVAAYVGVNMIGVAILAAAIVAVMFYSQKDNYLKKNTVEAVQTVSDETPEFFKID